MKTLIVSASRAISQSSSNCRRNLRSSDDFLGNQSRSFSRNELIEMRPHLEHTLIMVGIEERLAELRVFPTVLAHALRIVDRMLDVGDSVAKLDHDRLPIACDLRVGLALAFASVLAGLVGDAPGDFHHAAREPSAKQVFELRLRVFGHVMCPARNADDSVVAEAESDSHILGFAEVVPVRQLVVKLATMRATAPLTGSLQRDGAVCEMCSHR